MPLLLPYIGHASLVKICNDTLWRSPERGRLANFLKGRHCIAYEDTVKLIVRALYFRGPPCYIRILLTYSSVLFDPAPLLNEKKKEKKKRKKKEKKKRKRKKEKEKKKRKTEEKRVTLIPTLHLTPKG